MKIHESITLDRVMAAVEADDHLGFCLACGEEADGCEPDASGYECDVCGARAVEGAENLLFLVI
jgi:hypothetical protein